VQGYQQAILQIANHIALNLPIAGGVMAPGCTAG
jgi:hypothetical protein